MLPDPPESLAATLDYSWICLGYWSKRAAIPQGGPLTKGRAAIDGAQGMPCYQWLAWTEQCQPGRLAFAPGMMERRRRAVFV
jgi:hypothetical protein